MNRSIPWFWLALIGVFLLLPGPLGRFLLDLLGGLTLLVLLIPVLTGVAGFIGWQLLRSRLRTCAVCGLSSFGQEQCPACGSPLPHPNDATQANGDYPGFASPEMDASSATINVTAVDVETD